MKADEDVCSILIDLVADFWVGLEESVDKSITKKSFTVWQQVELILSWLVQCS